MLSLVCHVVAFTFVIRMRSVVLNGKPLRSQSHVMLGSLPNRSWHESSMSVFSVGEILPRSGKYMYGRTFEIILTKKRILNIYFHYIIYCICLLDSFEFVRYLTLENEINGLICWRSVAEKATLDFGPLFFFVSNRF